MRLPFRILTAGLILLISSAASRAQAAEDPWWKAFQVRQSFDGDSEEQNPGSVGLIDPGRHSAVYWLLDGGVRYKPEEPLYFGDENKHPAYLIWYPSVEWHHMSAEPLQAQDATNQGGPAINGELWFGGEPVSDSLQAYLLIKGALTRDVLNDTTEKSLTVMASLYQSADASVNGGFRPGTWIKVDGRQRIRYYPYFGFEYFRQLAITPDEDVIPPVYNGGDLLLRVDFEAMPFYQVKLPGENPFVVSGQYVYRRLLKESDAIDGRNPQFFTLDVSYYFMKDRTLGVGITLDNGRAPITNFVAQHRTAMVFKAKI